MDTIYITGHRNPDTDSIVAAMAYAALRNALGHREYVAACLGRVSDETQIVLDRFGFEPPVRIRSMFTQVRDLDFDKPPVFSAAVTMDRAWSVMEKLKATAIPVANDDGTLYGMLTRDDVANYNMSLVGSGKPYVLRGDSCIALPGVDHAGVSGYNDTSHGGVKHSAAVGAAAG